MRALLALGRIGVEGTPLHTLHEGLMAGDNEHHDAVCLGVAFIQAFHDLQLLNARDVPNVRLDATEWRLLEPRL